jgi:MFS family permease
MGLIDKFRSWSKDLTPYFIYVLLVSTLGPLLFGYHLAELNAPQQVITCEKDSIRSQITTSTIRGVATGLPHCIPMNTSQLGLVSSIFTLGGLIGALLSGSLSARYGRLPTMRYNTVLLTLGPILEALSPSITILSLGRFISGIGAGVSVVVVPIYISEIAPPKEKGFFGAFTQIMTNMGIFITQLLGYFLSRGQLWRIILAVAGVVGVLQFAGLWGTVESPKWLAEKGRGREARGVLKRVRGGNADINEEIEGWGVQSTGERREEEQALINDELRPDDDTSPSKTKTPERETVTILTVLTNPRTNRAILAVVSVMMAQQLCGINSIVMYGVSLLSDLLSSNSALLNILVSILNIVATTAFAPLADVLGRKPCLLISIAGMGISSVALGIGIRSSIPVLSALSVLSFVASFAFGLGPVPFILSSELVGPEAVGATQSWALAANWISTFVVAQFFPMVNERLGKGIVYFVFAGVAGVFLCWIGWFVPETKGRSDVDEIWGRKPVRED